MIQLKADLLLAEKDDDLYVLDVESGRVHCFNPTAKVIFQLCLEPVSFEKLVDEFMLFFPIQRGEAAEDIRMILSMMEQYGLLQTKDSGSV